MQLFCEKVLNAFLIYRTLMSSPELVPRPIPYIL